MLTTRAVETMVDDVISLMRFEVPTVCPRSQEGNRDGDSAEKRLTLLMLMGRRLMLALGCS